MSGTQKLVANAKRALALPVVGLALCSGAMAVTGASSLKLQVYSVLLSTSPQCTSPVTVCANATPTEVDFLVAPTLGSGNPPDGTYQCIIIKISDRIKFKPTANDGAFCVAGTEYTADVCQTGEITHAPDSPGAAANYGSGTQDLVHLYLSTARVGAGGGHAFEQPLAPNNTSYGVALSAPLVVAGTATSKFVVNAAGKVDGSAVSCGMNPPEFGFQKLP